MLHGVKEKCKKPGENLRKNIADGVSEINGVTPAIRLCILTNHYFLEL